jgi:hypothetical protein
MGNLIWGMFLGAGILFAGLFFLAQAIGSSF